MTGPDQSLPGHAAMPADAVLIKQVDLLEVYFSESEQLLFVKISGCQSGPARLTRQELAGLLNLFDQQIQEKEARLLAELDSDEDDF
ncbi:MAG: hypothetical protein C0402_15415 [Thermodesulfovibrio sp.]|nr:hypothetical protein [Thermodesulfovibrio sp.]